MVELGECAAACVDTSAGVLRGELGASELRGAIAACGTARAAALARVGAAVASDEAADAVLARVDAGFIARAGAWHALVLARNVAFLAGDVDLARDEELPGAVPRPTVAGAWHRFDHFLGVYAIPRSVWFRDALRAGLALAAAVLLAQSLGVDHTFWVALGTLSVLRSSALATGQTALAAALGTGVGFAISSAVLAVVGLDRGALWVLLVVSIFFAGYLPQVGGFVAGQAAFTVFVVVLFNLVEPQGWHTGLTRLEDVMLGAAVSAVVALLFWPRRLEPLVRRLMGDAAGAAGELLVGTTARVMADGGGPDRAPTVTAEARARVALIELMNQLRRRPEQAEPWIARLGVVIHARGAADAMSVLPALVPGAAPSPTDPALQALAGRLTDAAAVVQADLAPGLGHPDRSRSPQVESATRDAAVARDRRLPGRHARRRPRAPGPRLGRRRRRDGRPPPLTLCAARSTATVLSRNAWERPQSASRCSGIQVPSRSRRCSAASVMRWPVPGRISTSPWPTSMRTMNDVSGGRSSSRSPWSSSSGTSSASAPASSQPADWVASVTIPAQCPPSTMPAWTATAPPNECPTVTNRRAPARDARSAAAATSWTHRTRSLGLR